MRVLLVVCTLLALCTLSHALLGMGRTQSVAVQGRLICNGRPAGNVKVKLYNRETILDSKLDEGTTNANGEFRLSGSKNQITNIDPKLNVYHKCNYNGLCYKKFGIYVPKQFVSSGQSYAQRVYDVGTLNLMNKYTGETTDCIN